MFEELFQEAPHNQEIPCCAARRTARAVLSPSRGGRCLQAYATADGMRSGTSDSGPWPAGGRDRHNGPDRGCRSGMGWHETSQVRPTAMDFTEIDKVRVGQGNPVVALSGLARQTGRGPSPLQRCARRFRGLDARRARACRTINRPHTSERQGFLGPVRHQRLQAAGIGAAHRCRRRHRSEDSERPPYSRATIGGHAEELRVPLRFAEARGWCTPGMAEGIVPPRCYPDQKARNTLSRDEVRRPLATTDGGRRGDKGDRTILLLLIVYGLRAGEVRTLQLDDLDCEGETLPVHRLKTGRTDLCQRRHAGHDTDDCRQRAGTGSRTSRGQADREVAVNAATQAAAETATAERAGNNVDRHWHPDDALGQRSACRPEDHVRSRGRPTDRSRLRGGPVGQFQPLEADREHPIHQIPLPEPESLPRHRYDHAQHAAYRRRIIGTG